MMDPVVCHPGPSPLQPSLLFALFCVPLWWRYCPSLQSCSFELTRIRCFHCSGSQAFSCNQFSTPHAIRNAATGESNCNPRKKEKRALQLEHYRLSLEPKWLEPKWLEPKWLLEQKYTPNLAAHNIYMRCLNMDILSSSSASAISSIQAAQ